MKPNELLNIIGEAQDEYILDANAPVRRGRPSWVKWVAVAACLCFAVMGLFPLFGNHE